MSRLIKSAITTYIPGDPGNPGNPYIPATPGVWSAVEVTTCTPAGVPSQLSVTVQPNQTIFNALGLPPEVTGLPGTISYVIPLAGGVTVYVLQIGGDSVCSTSWTTVYTPPTPAVEAVPYSPPTPAQIDVSLNVGWNSSARSVDMLMPEGYFEFTVKPGSVALVSVGTAYMDDFPITSFERGILVDVSGAYAFENGEVVGLITTDVSPGQVYRINRLPSGVFQYDAGTSSYLSDAEPAYNSVFFDLYIYAHLYTAYDEISSAEFGLIGVFPNPATSALFLGWFIGYAWPDTTARLEGHASMNVSLVTEAHFSGEGFIEIDNAGEGNSLLATELDITMSGYTEFFVEVTSGGHGTITLEALEARGSDTASESVGTGYFDLPLITAYGSQALYVPATPSMGYLNLPFMTVWGFGSEIEPGNGSFELLPLDFIASEGEYGFGGADLSYITAGGSGGFIAEDLLPLFSVLVASTNYAMPNDLILILNSTGTLTSTLSLTRQHAMALLSGLVGTTNFELLGTYLLGLDSEMHATSLQALSVENRADLDSTSAVWVVNMDTKASSQYENYGFNSFFKRGDYHYGVANDGIYLLEGDNDDGADIQAQVDLVNTNMGVPNLKSVTDVYLAVSSEGEMILRTTYDGVAQYYRARSYSSTLKHNRVDLARGTAGVYWQFTLMNENGDDFNLAGLTFLPIVLNRRM